MARRPAGRLRLLASLASQALRDPRSGWVSVPPPRIQSLGEQLAMWVQWEAVGLSGSTVPCYRSRLTLLEAAAQIAPADGLWLEFGVFQGESINHLARLHRRQIFGFDSFEGLPSEWGGRYARGTFSTAGKVPVVADNVVLIKGWFTETLPAFLRARGPFTASFVHVDSDLYESASLVLTALSERIVPGTVIVFDEYTRILRDDEFRAFREYLASSGHEFRYVGCSAIGSVAVQITL